MDKLQLAYQVLSIEDFLDEYERLSLTDLYVKLYGLETGERPLPIVAYEILWTMLKAISVEQAVKMHWISEQDVLDVYDKENPASDWDTDQAMIDDYQIALRSYQHKCREADHFARLSSKMMALAAVSLGVNVLLIAVIVVEITK